MRIDTRFTDSKFKQLLQYLYFFEDTRKSGGKNYKSLQIIGVDRFEELVKNMDGGAVEIPKKSEWDALYVFAVVFYLRIFLNQDFPEIRNHIDTLYGAKLKISNQALSKKIQDIQKDIQKQFGIGI